MLKLQDICCRHKIFSKFIKSTQIKMKKYILILFLFLIYQVSAQNNKIYQNIKTLVNETQKIISIKKGEKIDTAYFRTMFLPSARFTVAGEENGKKTHETMTLNEFLVMLTDDYYSKGYYETSQGHIVEEYNGIAHTIQSFYGEDSDGVKAWGVGSQQLIFSDNRWWIANMIWTMSKNGKKGIPKKYLNN